MVIIILWTSITEVHAKGPQLNTLYVDIGQLYPRADFAGVLINLNVDQAIARGISALNLTDCFLQLYLTLGAAIFKEQCCVRLNRRDT